MTSICIELAYDLVQSPPDSRQAAMLNSEEPDLLEFRRQGRSQGIWSEHRCFCEHCGLNMNYDVGLTGIWTRSEINDELRSGPLALLSSHAPAPIGTSVAE